jgi:hypothetical protein
MEPWGKKDQRHGHLEHDQLSHDLAAKAAAPAGEVKEVT